MLGRISNFARRAWAGEPTVEPTAASDHVVDVEAVLYGGTENKGEVELTARRLGDVAQRLMDGNYGSDGRQMLNELLNEQADIVIHNLQKFRQEHPETPARRLAGRYIRAVLRKPDFEFERLTFFRMTLEVALARCQASPAQETDPDQLELVSLSLDRIKRVINAGGIATAASKIVDEVGARAPSEASEDQSTVDVDIRMDAGESVQFMLERAARAAAKGNGDRLRESLRALFESAGSQDISKLSQWAMAQLAVCRKKRGDQSRSLDTLHQLLAKVTEEQVIASLLQPDPPPPVPSASWGEGISWWWRLGLIGFQEGVPFLLGREGGIILKSLIVSAAYELTGDATAAASILYAATSTIALVNHFYFARLDGRNVEVPRTSPYGTFQEPPKLRAIRWLRNFSLAASLLVPPMVFACNVAAFAPATAQPAGYNSTQMQNASEGCSFSLPTVEHPDSVQSAAAAMLAVEELFLTGDLSRFFREIAQRVLQSPATSPVALAYKFPDGSIQKLTDRDIFRVGIARDLKYVGAQLAFNYGLRYASPELYEFFDRWLCEERRMVGWDIASATGGFCTEFLDGPIPSLANLEAQRFPKLFRLDPETAEYLACVYQEQKGPCQDWRSVLRDMEVGTSTRLWTQRVVSDLPAGLASVCTQAGAVKAANFLNLCSAIANGLVGSRRGSWGAYWKDPHGVPVPRGLLDLLFRPGCDADAETLRVLHVLQAIKHHKALAVSRLNLDQNPSQGQRA